MTSFPLIARVKAHRGQDYVASLSSGKPGVIAAAEVERLRTELRESAAELDRHGRHDAADLAVIMAARLGELLEGAESSDGVGGGGAA